MRGRPLLSLSVLISMDVNVTDEQVHPNNEPNTKALKLPICP